jgi:hypothetical protein
MMTRSRSKAKRWVPVCLTFALLLAIGPAAQAQSLFPNFGDQRVGTSSMAFLKIPVSARAEAMSGAYVAIANDAFAAFWNPGGIAQIHNRWTGKYVVDPERPAEGVKGPKSALQRAGGGSHSVGFIHFEWIGELQFDAVSAVTPIPFGVLGVSMVNLRAADMEVTTEYLPDGTGEYFSYGDILAGLTWAWPMTENFSWGVSAKYARETLADTKMENVLIDIGTYYWTGFRDLRLGVSLMHFGPNTAPEGTYVAIDPNGVEYDEDFEQFAPPTEFSLGTAMTLFATKSHRLLASAQLNHPVDNSENFRLGAEYSLKGMLFLRGGTKINTDEDHMTFGAGVRLPLGSQALGIDVSYTDFGLLDEVVRMSAELSF